MSYTDVADMQEDYDLRRRIVACAAIEGEDEPNGWVNDRVWDIAVAPGWAAAYSYAKSVGTAKPGKDPGVITDAMILAHVQFLRAQVP